MTPPTSVHAASPAQEPDPDALAELLARALWEVFVKPQPQKEEDEKAA